MAGAAAAAVAAGVGAACPAGGVAPVALPALALSAWAAEPRFVERPHLVTFLGLALTLLALERAGLRGARLYAGSWSEWSSDPSRAVEQSPGVAEKKGPAT